MTEEIKTYYIPTNPNIKKGTIYTLYINNNTNLNLQSIINYQPKKYTILEQDYIRLLELTNLTNKITTNMQNFLKEESKTITEITKINTERQELIKKIKKEK